MLFNVVIITFLIVGLVLLNTQNIVLDRFLNINDEAKTNLVGAGVIESNMKLWGYRILSVVIIISVLMAINFFKKNSSKNVIKSLSIVPIYLVGLFVLMVGYRAMFINGSELDKEKSYIWANIDYTKTAYNLKIDETELDNTGTISLEQSQENEKIVNNSPIVTEKIVLNNLTQTQTSTGYYTYNRAKATYYNDKLIYISAREINARNTTYNSKADEYTHGYGAVLVSSSETDENGNIVYLSKEFENEDIKEPRIYYGTETNSVISVSENSEEFDYPVTSSQNVNSNYEGNRRNFSKFLR